MHTWSFTVLLAAILLYTSFSYCFFKDEPWMVRLALILGSFFLISLLVWEKNFSLADSFFLLACISAKLWGLAKFSLGLLEYGKRPFVALKVLAITLVRIALVITVALIIYWIPKPVIKPQVRTPSW